MFNQFMVVFLKEFKCIIRDKKTFLFGLILPLVLVPAMLFIIDFSMKNTQNQIADNVNIAVSSKNNSFYSFCSAQNNLTVVDVEDPAQALDSGAISAYITVDDNLDEKALKNEEFELNIKYNESSINSMMAAPTIIKYESTYRYIISNYEFENAQKLNEIIAIDIPLDEETPNMFGDMSSLYFNMLVPMMLILYCCIGSAGTASDLSAGEKERGTLEPLLSTGANRTSIIMGKLLATTFMGVVSGLFTVIGLWGYLLVSSKSSSVHISTLDMAALITVTIFVAMFFAAVNLTIGVYSRSYKEAQTYLMPVSVVALIPTFFTYTLDINTINIAYLCIPILNVVCVIKEIFAGAVNFLHLGIVLGWLIAYVIAASLITAKLFKKENIIFRM